MEGHGISERGGESRKKKKIKEKHEVKLIISGGWDEGEIRMAIKQKKTSLGAGEIDIF